MRPRAALEGHAFGVLAAVGTAAALFAVVGLSVAYLPMNRFPGTWFAFPDLPWLDGWARWDGGWYASIAENGYWLDPGRQSPVVFFPGYPFLMRLGARLVGSEVLAGILVTLASGVAAAFLFHRWSSARLRAGAARVSVLALLLYPFAFYLYGAVYADALFLAAALAAFVLLEEGHPWLAGIAGALATATRPVGIALAAGLVIRGVQVRRRDPAASSGWRRLLPHPGVLLSPLGLAAFCAFLWKRFGDPLAFVGAAAAAGWGLAPGPRTWLKAELFRMLAEPRWGVGHRMLIVHAAVTLGALALVPAVWRRFGAAYGVYTLVVLALPALSSKDLFGMGRYVLAAFPCFTVAGDWISRRPRLVAPLLAASGGTMAFLASLFSRWYYLS